MCKSFTFPWRSVRQPQGAVALGTFTSTLIPDASLIWWITFKLPRELPTTLATDVRQLFLALVSVSALMDWACAGVTNPAAASATTVKAMKLEQRITAFPIQDGELRFPDHTPSMPG